MAMFMCKKCGATDYYLQEKGFQVGIYCAVCGSWQKWIGKKSLNEYRMGGHRVHGANETIELIKNAPLGVESDGFRKSVTFGNDIPFGVSDSNEPSVVNNGNQSSMGSVENIEGRRENVVKSEVQDKKMTETMLETMIETEVDRRVQERLKNVAIQENSGKENSSENANSDYCPLCEGEPMVSDGNSRVEVTVFGGVMTVTDPEGQTIYGIYKLKRCPHCGRIF